MIIVADRWNTIGIAAARLVGVVTFLAMIIVAEKKFLGGVLYAFWAATLGRLFIASLVTALIEWFIISTSQPGWIIFVVVGLAGAAVYAVVLLVKGYL